MKTLDIILIIVAVLAVIGIIILAWPKSKIDIQKNVTTQPIISPPIPITQQTVQTPITIPIPVIPTNPNTNISTLTNTNPIGGDGKTPIIIVETQTAKAGTVIINETIMQDTTPITDAECETDIINQANIKVVDFRSFYNVGDGTMTYTWDNATPGIYTISQYCWEGIILDQNKIYNNSTIIIT